ncbi:MAG: RAD55 family ATPase [Desulfurococcaceae archaeon TW002]
MSKTFLTGISPLNIALPAGIPYGSLILLLGPGGVGKSVMLANLSWNFLKDSRNAVVHVTFDDSPDALLALYAYFGWDISRYVAEGRFKIVDCFSFRLGPFKKTVSGVVRELEVKDLSSLVYAVSDASSSTRGSTMVLIDSLNELILKFEVSQFLDFIKSLRAVIGKGLGNIIIATIHTTTETFQEVVNYLEYLVDGVIETRFNPSLLEYGIPLKELLVRKMRGVPTNPVWIPYVISNDGIAAVDPQKLAMVLQEKIKEAEKLKKLLSGSED